MFTSLQMDCELHILLKLIWLVVCGCCRSSDHLFRSSASHSKNDQQQAHQLVGRQNVAPLEFNPKPKPSEAAFSTVFRCSFRTEVVSDVISGANIGQVDMDVPMKFCI